jgi:hypothetical protein
MLCNPNYLEVGGSWSETCLGKNVRPYLKNKLTPVPVAHICNPSYLGGRDQEDLQVFRANPSKQF